MWGCVLDTKTELHGRLEAGWLVYYTLETITGAGVKLDLATRLLGRSSPSPLGG
jgi:hypothetical protein